MERGLLWLPLLLMFIGLAWAGWKEYRKVEAYKAWATQFDTAKYDVYSVLGRKHMTLTWGQPTQNGPINLATASLGDVEFVSVQVDGKAIDLNHPPSKASRPMLVLGLVGDRQVQIPFTDLTLTIEWFNHLQAQLKQYPLGESSL